MRSSYWIRGKFKRFFDEFELTQQQFNVLSILEFHHPSYLTTKTISKYMLDNHADTSRVVDRLVMKQYVSKEKDPTDQRLVQIIITDSGLALVKKIYDQFPNIDDWTGKLTDQEVNQLIQLLKKLGD
ncbi:MAG: MarR family transcriptional regulator [Bacteroidota bacterium]